MTDEQYVEYVTKCWRQHEDAMQHTHPQWRELWQLYQNKQDWSKKQGWQSQCFLPKIMMQVERAAGEVKRAVMQTRKLFKLELDDDAEQQQIQALNEQKASVQDANGLIAIEQQIDQIRKQLDVKDSRRAMREKQLKKKLDDSAFSNVYAEMIKVAMLLGLGVPKLIYADGKFKFEHVDATDCAVSPDYRPFSSSRPAFIIERQEMGLAEFRARVKNSPSGIWKKTQVKKIEDDCKKLEDFDRERARRGYGEYGKVNRRVVLKYYWGDVSDPDDKKLEENLLLVVANDKYLIRKHENPFAHGNPPFVLTMPIIYPHRGTHGISLVAPQVRLQYTLNNVVNMFMDNLNFSITKMFEYNPDDLINPGAMNTMYPGKTIAVNTPSGQQAIREVVTTPVKRDALYIFELINKEMQEGSGVTEYLSGLPGRKSRTLGEIERKTAESRGLFDTIGRDLEMNSIKPLLEMAYDLCVQFEGWEPRQGNYTFTVSGLTVMLQQRELAENVGQALAMALQAPQLTQMTDIADLWKQFLAVHNLSHTFKEPSSGSAQLDPAQAEAITQKAEQDAKQAVSEMPPEQIMKLTG